MSHIQYTICRNSTYYYNRRVPKHAVNQYGQFIRYSLGKCPDLAAKIAHRLSVLLEDSWNQKSYSTSIDIEAAISSYKPKSKQDQPGKPPAAQPLRSRWIPDDDPTPRVNVSYRKVPKRFHNYGKLSNAPLRYGSYLRHASELPL